MKQRHFTRKDPKSLERIHVAAVAHHAQWEQAKDQGALHYGRFLGRGGRHKTKADHPKKLDQRDHDPD